MRGIAARRRGMTLLELTLGLFSLGVLGAAVLMIMAAAGNAWSARDDYQRQTMDTRGIVSTIGRWVREGERIISVYKDVSGNRINVVLWVSDDNFPGDVNLSEVRILTYRKSERTLAVFTAELTDEEAGDEVENETVEPVVIGTANGAIGFKQKSSVNRYVLANNVMRFTATASGGEAGKGYTFLSLRMGYGGNAAEQLEVMSMSIRVPDDEIDFGNTEESMSAEIVVGTVD